MTPDMAFAQFLNASTERFHTDADYHARVNRELFETDARIRRMREWEQSIWDKARGAA